MVASPQVHPSVIDMSNHKGFAEGEKYVCVIKKDKVEREIFVS